MTNGANMMAYDCFVLKWRIDLRLDHVNFRYSLVMTNVAIENGDL